MSRPRIKDNFDYGGSSKPGSDNSVVVIVEGSNGRRLHELGAHRQAGPARALQQHEMDLIRRTAGMSVLEDPAKFTAIVEAMDAIREQTGKILRSGVQIGREMIALLDRLSNDEGQKVVRAGSELFAGWSSGNLTKMIGAARLFDSGWVDKALLPTSYTVLYQLSQLDRPLLEHAVDRDLIHPDLSRTEVEQLRRTITIVGVPIEEAREPDGTTELFPELAKINSRLAELRKEARTLSSRRQKLLAGMRRVRGEQTTR